MSKSSAFETEILDLIFKNLAIADIGNSGGLLPSTVPGNLYVSLHTSDPGEGGVQSTNECAYTGYAREAVVRSASGWTVSGNGASNAALITFGESSTSETATHFGIGAESSGGTLLLYSGVLTADLSIINGTVPEFGIGDCNVAED